MSSTSRNWKRLIYLGPDKGVYFTNRRKNVVIHETIGPRLGEVVMLEDGFHYFWRDDDRQCGAESSYVLRAIADMLDELNTPWEREINDYFADQEAAEAAPAPKEERPT